jgi:putative flippase GtrA
MMRATSRTVRFGMIGAVGFCVDSSVLTLLVNLWGVSPIAARLVSFSLAVLATWYLNRTYTFQVERLSRGATFHEVSRYLMVQIVGAVVNLGIFTLLIELFASLRTIPVLPLAAGAFVSMLVTYIGARRFAFHPLAKVQS